jgi:hypothetical protein
MFQKNVSKLEVFSMGGQPLSLVIILFASTIIEFSQNGRMSTFMAVPEGFHAGSLKDSEKGDQIGRIFRLLDYRLLWAVVFWKLQK